MATIAEQILLEKVGRAVAPGEIVKVPIDFAFGYDITLPPAIEEFEKLETNGVFDPDSVAVIPDHLIPAHSDHAAELYTACREFAEEYDTVFYPQGKQGQEHVIIPGDGLVKPGDVMIGADSHTCTEGALGAFSTGVGSTDLAFAMAFGWLWFRIPETTRIEYVGEPEPWVTGKDLILETLGELGVDGDVSHALEFGGSVIEGLLMDERFTVANMAIEAGAATGIVEPDETTAEFANEHTEGDYKLYTADENAEYENRVKIDCEGLEPQVAVPNLPANSVPTPRCRTRVYRSTKR